MILLDKILSIAGFVFACVAILVGPWLFGAWEMWWFWPFAVCIFISTFFFSFRLILPAFMEGPSHEQAHPNLKSKIAVVLSFLPFLAYAFVRFLQADVFMNAERSFLLFLTPFLLGVQIVFGFSRKQLKLLSALVLGDLCLLGLYGIINHVITGSKLVLWAEGYPGYIAQHRATGSYFCPDHFSGIMEMAFCLCLGLLLARETHRRERRFAGLLALIALYGVVLSKSRGGGLTVVVIAFAVLVWGFSQWPAIIRWYCRGSAIALLAMSVAMFCLFDFAYKRRFMSYFAWDRTKVKSFEQLQMVMKKKLRTTSRGHMITGAIRAWKTEPVWGIGPGMHQNLWPHFATSDDGDRELGQWPTYNYSHFHSYEVHSDWIQLLEEYGLAGLFLFLLPWSAVFIVLLAGINQEVRECRRKKWLSPGRRHHAIVLGGLLAWICMSFHSLGDFNLQMPATVWLLAAILAIPVAYVLRR